VSNIKSQKIGLWCTWIFSALTAVGWLGIAHFYQPAPADLGLAGTHEWYSQINTTGTLIGCTLFYIAAGILVPGSIQFGIMLSKMEGRFPLWSLTTAVCGIFISLIIFFNACTWIVAAYRPEFGADVIQALNDWAWMGFLLGWFYLAVEMAASAIVELSDSRDVPMVPRPVAWATLAGAITLMTAAGPAFFKSGPFAYHGLLGFYLPVLIWGVYLNGTAYLMYQELCREEQAAGRVSGAAPAAAGHA